MKSIVLAFFLVLSVCSQSFSKSEIHEGACAADEFKENSQTTALLSALRKQFKKQKISKELCAEVKTCFKNMDWGEEEEEVCSLRYAEEMFQVNSACGLKAEELFSLGQYMGSLYQCLNKSLYSDEGPKYKRLLNSINSALSRFPRYEGFVFRGSSLPQAIVDKHKEGEVVEYKAFTSTSTSQSVSRGFSGGFSGQMFLIYSKTGRPVMGLTFSEREVLFKAGTKFKVLKVLNNHFVMREFTPGESKEKEKAEDERVMSLVKKVSQNENNQSSGDVWHCPVDPKKIPKVLKQKFLPDLKNFTSTEEVKEE